jgi:putative flippase GtrA
MSGKIDALIGVLPPFARSEAFVQLVRFAIAGLGVTLFSTLVYLTFAYPFHLKPMQANALSYCAGFIASYAAHSRWSFRARAGEDAFMILRFVAASGFAFALNSLWVWLATGLFHLPALAPVPAMVFATPLASFVLNRYWVFRAAGPSATPA